MLRMHVLEAVEKGRFRIWAITTVDDGLEILTGMPSQEIHERAIQRLEKLAKFGKRYDTE